MKLLEISVVAKKLSVSERTVRRMIDDPESPLVGVRVYKKSIRVTAESLERCLSPVRPVRFSAIA